MFLTLNEYLLGAQKILNLYGYNVHKNNEDAISFVASYMMKADQTWDGHSSSRDTWRFNQARYAILKLKNKHHKQKKTVSLNKVVSTRSREIILSDIIADKTQIDFMTPFNEVMNYAKKCLTKTQFSCLKLYYIEQKTMEEVGLQLGITKQAVSLNIKKAIKILKNECRNSTDYITS